VLPDAKGSICLIEAPESPEDAEDMIPEIPDLIVKLRSQFGCVIINTGAFWSETTARIAQETDRLCFVMDQRTTSVRGCKQAAELCLRLQIPSSRFLYLLNRCSKNAPISDLDASLALDGAPIVQISDGGSIVDELLALGCPDQALESSPVLADSLKSLLANTGLFFAAGAKEDLQSSKLNNTGQKNDTQGYSRFKRFRNGKKHRYTERRR
jgi:pilus assembly protein CpaE